MNKKLTNSSLYDEEDPDIKFLKNIINTNKKIVLNQGEDHDSEES